MIKVCHMSSSHKNTDGRIFQKQCTALAKEGYEVCLIAQGQDFEKNGVKVTGVPEISGGGLTGRLKRWIKSAKSVYKRTLETNADIYQIHDPELLPYLMKLKKKGKKIIFDIHENFIERILDAPYIPKLLRPIVYFFAKIYYNSMIRKCDAVITVTPAQYERFKKINNNTHIITNYPIVSDFNEVKMYTVSKNIVYIGQISKLYCHNTIIESLKKCHNVRYILYGLGEKEYINQLKQLPEWNSVDFSGVIPHKDVPRKLKEASVGMAVIEYHRNVDGQTGTLGNTKIFEYMMEALPIICTDFILWKAIIEKYNCGICVNPYNIEEIANAINYLLDNPEIAKEMGQNGRRAVLEEFNWGVEEKKLINLYKSLAEKI